MVISEKKLKELVSKTLNERPDLIYNFKKGDQRAFGMLIAEIMKKTKGKGDSRKIKTILETRL